MKYSSFYNAVLGKIDESFERISFNCHEFIETRISFSSYSKFKEQKLFSLGFFNNCFGFINSSQS